MNMNFYREKEMTMATIRYVQEKDLPRILEIYNYYVENSYAIFDEKPKTMEEQLKAFSRYKESGPYRAWVIEENEKVLGHASSNEYRAHPAFKETIEVSIYLDPETRGKGYGTLLYQTLFAALQNENLHLAVSGIALPNPASVELHKKFGFTEVGVFQEYASKRGQKISSIWLQKKLR